MKDHKKSGVEPCRSAETVGKAGDDGRGALEPCPFCGCAPKLRRIVEEYAADADGPAGEYADRIERAAFGRALLDPITEGEPSEAEVERIASRIAADTFQHLAPWSVDGAVADVLHGAIQTAARAALLAAKSKGGQA